MLTTQFVLVVCFIADRERILLMVGQGKEQVWTRETGQRGHRCPREPQTLRVLSRQGRVEGRCRRPRLELFCSFLKTWACRGFSAPCLLRPCSEAGAFGRRLSQLFCCKVGNTFMGGKRCSFVTQSGVFHASLWAFFLGQWVVLPTMRLDNTRALRAPPAGSAGSKFLGVQPSQIDGFPIRGIC